jgi:hypothetical protein
MPDGISDLEVVQAFAQYELEHRPGVLGSEELPAETLMRKPGRRGIECNAACDRAVELGLVRWHAFDVAQRGLTEQGRALLAAAATEQKQQ